MELARPCSLAAFIPPTEVWTAILAGLAVTAALLLFARPSFKVPMTLPRYSAAIGVGIVVWGVLLGQMAVLPLHEPEDVLRLVAGGLTFLTAVFCNYYLGNISAGFRIEMLVNLANAGRDVTLDEWMALYGRGRGMHYFLEDRLKALLLPWKLAVIHDDIVVLTRWGHVVGCVVSFLALVFAEE